MTIPKAKIISKCDNTFKKSIYNNINNSRYYQVKNITILRDGKNKSLCALKIGVEP